MSYISQSKMIHTAATIRKAVDYPRYADKFETHTDGMAEVISHLTGLPYFSVRAKIVDEANLDPRSGLECSRELAKGKP